MSRSRARYSNASSTHPAYASANRQQQQSQTSVFAPHNTNERMTDGFNLSPTTAIGARQRRGTAASDANDSSAGSAAANLAPRPTDQTYRGGGEGNRPSTSTNILGVNTEESPVNTAAGNRDGFGVAAGSGNRSHGGQKHADDANADEMSKAFSGGPNGVTEGERLNEQSRLLNDGKGRLCKLAVSARGPNFTPATLTFQSSIPRRLSVVVLSRYHSAAGREYFGSVRLHQGSTSTQVSRRLDNSPEEADACSPGSRSSRVPDRLFLLQCERLSLAFESLKRC